MKRHSIRKSIIKGHTQKKKAQIQGQIFIYLVAIVLVSLILIYGYGAIKKMRGDIKQVSIIKFQTNLGNMVDKVALDYGSVKVYNEKDPLHVPSEYSFVCFADTTDPRIVAGMVPSEFPLIRDSLDSGAKENVFLVDRDLKNSLYMEKMKVKSSFFCTPVVQGSIYLALEGFGDYAEASRIR